jgi:hypothetical protein
VCIYIYIYIYERAKICHALTNTLHFSSFFSIVALYVTEHCFGIGALFLAVPVTVFIIKIVLGGIPSGDKVLLVPASPTVEIGKG